MTGDEPADDSTADGADRRAHSREAVLWAGTMAIGEQEMRCTIHDISSGGARLDTGQELHTNQQVVLSIDGMGEIRARVAWRDGNLVGLAFLVGASYVTRMITTR